MLSICHHLVVMYHTRKTRKYIHLEIPVAGVAVSRPRALQVSPSDQKNKDRKVDRCINKALKMPSLSL